MSLDRRGNVDIGDYLAVDNEERFVLEKLARIIERSSRSENMRFLHVAGDRYSELPSVAQGRDDRIGLVMKIYNDVRYAEASNVLRHVPHQWFSQEWDRRFGSVDS